MQIKEGWKTLIHCTQKLSKTTGLIGTKMIMYNCITQRITERKFSNRLYYLEKKK